MFAKSNFIEKLCKNLKTHLMSLKMKVDTQMLTMGKSTNGLT